MSSAPDDPALRDIVARAIDRFQAAGRAGAEEVIAAHPDAAAVIRRRLDVLEGCGLLAPVADDDAIPERIGEYRIVERLGSGGMGVVFLVDQPSLGRQVALKLIRPEYLYFEGARERFRREVETIARLQHPGIVRVHAAAQEGDLPYFTMERVEGVSLDRLLRRLRARAPAELREADVRAALQELGGGDEVTGTGSRPWLQIVYAWVLALTDAVEYAHRHGVVHRDIKPSNIMITWSMRPVLLDFGLARPANASAITRTGVRPGSLPYMAPEQLLGDSTQVDARTDVYALGVVCYELLTLRNPFSSEQVSEEQTRQRIVAAAVPPARLTNPAVSWDTETVCRCAMAPEPQERYASAADLGRDIQNLIEHRPITARRPHASLRLRRYAQRHPARAVAFVMGALLLTVTPTVFAVTEYRLRHEITRAKEDVEAEAGTRADILRFFNDDLLGAVSPGRMGKDATMRAVLDAASQKVEGRFPDRPLVEAEIRATLGRTYTHLGELDLARRHLDTALALYVRERGADDRLSLATERNLGTVLSFQEQYAEHEELLRRNHAACRRQFGDKDKDTLGALNDLGLLLTRRGKHAEAEAFLLEVVETRLRLLGEDDEATQAAMSNLGVVYYNLGRYADAEPWVKRELDLCRKQHGDDHPSTLISRHNHANLLASMGRVDEAVANLRSVVDASRRVLGDRHVETRNAMGSLARQLSTARRHDEALHWYEEVLRCSDDLPATDPKLLFARIRHADGLRAVGRLDEADGELGAAREVCEGALGPHHALTGMAQRMQADLWIAQGRRAEAAELVAGILAAASGEATGQLAHLRLRHAGNLRALGRHAEAEAQLRDAHAFFAEARVGDPALGRVFEEYAALTEAMGKPDEAAVWRERLQAWRATRSER